LNDPVSKKFDDDYKQNYVMNKSSVWDNMKRTWRNFMSGFTYDQYKDLIAQRNYNQDIADYYNTLVDERNNAQKSNKNSDFLFAKVNPQLINRQRKASTDRTLESYSADELLKLDEDNTQRRISDLNEELRAY
jgi:hypothetical protein